jgi:SHS2 domain-containing protein
MTENQNSISYFDHDADIGIRVCAATLERAFEMAAEAMFAVMVDLSAVGEAEHIEFSFEEADLELALVQSLNRLLAESRTHGLALKRFAVRREDDHWLGEAWGAPWQKDSERGTEVKGATLTALSVAQEGDHWQVQCVVDV